MKRIIKILIIALIMMTSIFLFMPNKVNAEVEAFHNFTGLYIRSTEAGKGEKVYVDLYCMKDVTEVKSFLKAGDQYLTVEIQDIKTNDPYFIMPEEAKDDVNYEMTAIEVTCPDGKVTYGTTIGSANYTNCFEKKYVKAIKIEEKNTISLVNLALNSQENIITKDKNEKLFINVETEGNKPELMTFIVKNKNDENSKALVSLETEGDSQYLDFSKVWGISSLTDGTYYITDVYINPNKTDYIRYSKDENQADALKLKFDIQFEIKNEEEIKTDKILKSIVLSDFTASRNDKIYVDMELNNFEANQVMLSFSDKKNQKSFVVYLKDLKTKPYFSVPVTTEYGEYELNYVILKDIYGYQKRYRSGKKIGEIEHFDFNINLKIEESEKEYTDLLNIDNDKISMEIIKKINELESNITIEIDASNNPIIDKSVFEAIKGQDKILIIKYNDVEWIFNGNDIKNSKSIDVSIQITNNVDTGVSKGVKFVFAENGVLPGKCLIRIYNSNIMNNVLEKQKVNVYYYDSDEKLYDKITNNISMSEDGYYEFYIDHNSSYVLTNDEVSETYIMKKADVNNTTVTEEQKDDKYKYIMIAGFVLALFAFIFSLINLFKKK